MQSTESIQEASDERKLEHSNRSDTPFQARIQDSTTGGPRPSFRRRGGAKAPKSQNFPKIIRDLRFRGGGMAPLAPLYTGLLPSKRDKTEGQNGTLDKSGLQQESQEQIFQKLVKLFRATLLFFQRRRRLTPHLFCILQLN